MTGDLTNHNSESAILSVKQTRKESRLTSVDLNLKNGMYCLSVVEMRYEIPSDVHSCLFHVITSKKEDMVGSRAV